MRSQETLTQNLLAQRLKRLLALYLVSIYPHLEACELYDSECSHP